ncbi:glycerol-3-phosphate dehydrogenase [Nadsonia fulvescens var. elongata DSM 6958]|uniref:Glycerol-3-phosphate dehydrogenase [NAD(+)] n=1 Tax=Nadsonia fulvescens var. elongata DSM 6958 TaxID=857566 RepID=A0A1E3PJK9_9ASCO|nr:glycerol-3-phosphate dehydrogenase [Nadsonia fulvescens var. elongata DSM 6958]
MSTPNRFKVTVVGSGNWGTTTAKIVAENVAIHTNVFDPEVRMWVFEEVLDGEKLSEIINTRHENIKYLPGVKLPSNLIAVPDLVSAVEGSQLLVFNVPHQFLSRICKQLKGHISSKVRAISCLKGLEVDDQGVRLLSDYITGELGIHCGVLSGANLAPEVALEKYSETTIAYPLPENHYPGDATGETWQMLFHRPYFHVRVVNDIAGVSIAGALKNVVALAAGFVEGKGWGENAKAAIMRRGIIEMIKFCKIFFNKNEIETFTQESAGIADLITTCAAGRNVRVGSEMARSGRSVEEVEAELLNGQSAQGMVTAKEIHSLLENKGLLDEFPLLEITYQMAFNGYDIDNLPAFFEKIR